MSSIKLVAAQDIGSEDQPIAPLLLPEPGPHYQARAERLLVLAKEHVMADYLGFTADLAAAQQQVLSELPLPDSANARLERVEGQAPLAYAHVQRDPYWRQVLRLLLERMRPVANAQTLQVLDELQDSSDSQLEHWAGQLLAGNFAGVGSGRALFVWSALSLYWSQLAARLPLRAVAKPGEQRQFCPVCASAPSASVVLGGERAGLRYLHCSLCESRWHMVRIKCSNCEQSEKLEYWSLESREAPLKAESCGDCNSYLKVIYLDKAIEQEVVADDLASLALDAEMEQEGFARSGPNPLLFPG